MAKNLEKKKDLILVLMQSKEKLETNKKIKDIFDQDCNNLIKPNSPDLTQLAKRNLRKQMTNISYMLSKTNIANFQLLELVKQ